jgi:NitT/TauT family transport system ATP-binding protein
MTTRPKVELRGISQRFPGSTRGQNDTLALDAIDLHIHDREIVSLVGPSGCGKSTILNLIAGFVEPTSGEILIDGSRLDGIKPERLVVFQSATLFPWLSVIDNVTFGPRMRGLPSSEYQPIANQVIADIGLSRFSNHFPYQLSGGMKQRVQIARALVNQPKILLLDEPFGALDAQTRLEMQELLLRIWDQYQCTILFITHDVEEALFLSNRIYMLSPHPGRVQREINVPFDRPRTLSLFGDSHFSQLKAEILTNLHSKTAAENNDSGLSASDDDMKQDRGFRWLDKRQRS